MFRAMFLSLLLVLTLPFAATAQDNQRQRYLEGREQFDALVMQRRMGEALRVLTVPGTISDADVAAVNQQIMGNYVEDFIAVDLVRSATLKGGFRQEMLGFWNDEGQYLYIYFLLHTRENELNVLMVNFDSDFHKLYSLF